MPRRRLTQTEIQEARLVFGDGLNYRRAFVVENTQLPNVIATLGRAPRPNAISLGDTCYFPETLKTTPEAIANGDLRAMAWLMHELTHIWQYQRLGWQYLYRTVSIQLGQGVSGYHYLIEPGRRLADYNLEQQGDIARDYYCAVKTGWNCTRTTHRNPADWLALIEDFQIPAGA